jgi:exosome complex exonuclease RRP6
MIEIPFVPAPLRQTVKAEVVDDAIVVVGQRQKKRKRVKKAELPSTPAEDTKAEPEEVVPFDFASAPNILDDGPSEHSEDGRPGKKRRSRKRSGGVFFLPLILPPLMMSPELTRIAVLRLCR